MHREIRFDATGRMDVPEAGKTSALKDPLKEATDRLPRNGMAGWNRLALARRRKDVSEKMFSNFFFSVERFFST